MTQMYGVIGTSNPTNLLADPQGADRIAIPCEPGSGTIPAGTVMYRKESGLWAPATADEVVDTNQFAILNDAVDAGEAPAAGETAVATDAVAYRAGRFIDGMVTLDAGTALTEADKVILRMQGIVFNKKESITTFDNTLTTPEEDDL